jgi:hypothetical protein
MSVSEPTDHVLPKLGKAVSSGTLNSPANSQDFAPRRENRNRGINISNPFPHQNRRYCTGEGKNNAIQEFVRKKDKEGD